MHFNGDVVALRLFDGWEKLLDFYELTSDVVDIITYYINVVKQISRKKINMNE